MTGLSPAPAAAAQLLRLGASRLATVGISDPRLEARLLLAAATGLSRSTLVTEPDLIVGAAAVMAFTGFVERRAKREPLAYILGQREFWGLPFAVAPGVLIPRPETETLIEAALDLFPDRQQPLEILDMGVGSGCLLLTLLHLYPRARGAGLDRSEVALDVTAQNASRMGQDVRLQLVRGEWESAPRVPFDLVVSNPPYVAQPELSSLEPDVRDFEPYGALVAGSDGLDAYRALLPVARRSMTSSSVLLLEIGKGQAAEVRRISAASRVDIVDVREDLAGIERCLVGRLRSSTG